MRGRDPCALYACVERRCHGAPCMDAVPDPARWGEPRLAGVAGQLILRSCVIAGALSARSRVSASVMAILVGVVLQQPGHRGIYAGRAVGVLAIAAAVRRARGWRTLAGRRRRAQADRRRTSTVAAGVIFLLWIWVRGARSRHRVLVAFGAVVL